MSITNKTKQIKKLETCKYQCRLGAIVCNNKQRWNATTLSCISMSNQKCKARPEIVYVDSNNPIFYPFSIKTSKCSGNCNNINDPYASFCVPDFVKNLNVKV